MTKQQIMDRFEVTEPTFYAWVRAGKVVETGVKPSRRGKPTKLYEVVVADPMGASTPKWLLFEKKCTAAQREPSEVLKLLLTRCNSTVPTNSEASGDPDFFECALHLVLNAGKSFIDCLLGYDGPPGLVDVAKLIREAPSVANGELPDLTSYDSFNQSWEAAKSYVGNAMQDGTWRFNRNPMIDTTDPSKSRVVMRSRWHNKLPTEVLGGLYVLDKIASIDPDEFLPKDKRYHEAFKRFLLRFNELIHNCGDRATELAMGALVQFRWLYFDDRLSAGEDHTPEPKWSDLTEMQRGALEWVQAQMPDKKTKQCAIKFATAWGARYQGRSSERATWASVNRIFQTHKYAPIPNFDPEADLNAEPHWFDLNSSSPETKLDWANYWYKELRSGPRPAKPKFTGQVRDDDGGAYHDGGGAYDDAALDWDWSD